MIRAIEEIQKLSVDANVIPIYKEFVADLDTPISVLKKVCDPNSEECFLLESVEVGEKLARYSFIGAKPFYSFEARGEDILIREKTERRFKGKALDELKVFMGRFRGYDEPDLPAFAGGAVGFVCYDAIRLIEDIPSTGVDSYNLPELHFGLYDAFVVFDHLKHKLLLVANILVDESDSLELAYKKALAKISEMEELLGAPLKRELRQTKKAPKWESNMTQDEYEEKVRRCQEYIKAGDAFQIVLSQRLSCKPESSALNIYRALRSINPSPYMYYMRYQDLEIVGASPETLVKVEKGWVETKPIAGTRPRGSSEEEDERLEKELLGDAKEVAEHVMLVDLGRNDIGRVCEYGTVTPTQFMGVERLSHVMHISSIVKGKLRKGIHALDALMSCLPAGTLSGAPKIRAMQIIDELEPHRRGIYGGAICYMDFRGNLDSCIAIRTMVMKDGIAYLQAGAGIVADSQPTTEFEETHHKAKALVNAVALAAGI